jgi:hypothetical protein
VHGAGVADATPAVRATDRSVARGDRVPPPDDVPAPDVRPTRPAYRVVPVTGGGAVAGAVLLDGPPPADSTVTCPRPTAGRVAPRSPTAPST